MKKIPVLYNQDMEQPHEDYHLRPFPQQPKRGGKKLIEALHNLETAVGSEVPDFEKMREIQAQIHTAAASFNDDRLVDRLRTLSSWMDQFLGSPQKSIRQKIAELTLQILVELKHL